MASIADEVVQTTFMVANRNMNPPASRRRRSASLSWSWSSSPSSSSSSCLAMMMSLTTVAWLSSSKTSALLAPYLPSPCVVEFGNPRCRSHQDSGIKPASRLVHISLERNGAFGCKSPNGARSAPHAGGALQSSMGVDEMTGDGKGVKDGLVKQEFGRLLEEGNAKECLKLMRRSGQKLEISMPDGANLLNAVSKAVLLKPQEDEKDIVDAYAALKSMGLLKAFGSIDLDVVPSKSRQISPRKLMELTGMEVKNLAPGRPTGSWLAAGAGLLGLEVLVGRMIGVDALTSIIPVTLALVFFDKLFVGGAVAESAIRAVVPEYLQKVIRHEAGHFLLAYLLGCPVQGCLLDPFEVGKYARSGAQGGTVFADPAFAKGMASGKLTRTAIDRFSIVLMGGIAAEAIEYGTSEGGSSDERVMIEILSSVTPAFNIEQIKSQALWAAVQAVLLIREHKDAYEVLVSALERRADVGECVTVLEKELSKKPLPGDVRREDIKPISPADEVKSMVIRRMSQKYWQQQDERKKERMAEMEAAEKFRRENKDNYILDLQRRVEELERTIAAGMPLEETGLTSDAGGVWMNDLKALREDILASTREVASIKPGSAAIVGSGRSPAVRRSKEDVAAAQRAASEGKLRDIETKKEENARRIAEVEARIQQFEEEHA